MQVKRQGPFPCNTNFSYGDGDLKIVGLNSHLRLLRQTQIFQTARNCVTALSHGYPYDNNVTTSTR
jgi:hypothetical protein